MTTLTNSYHNSAAKTRLTAGDIERIKNTNPDDWTAAERQTVRRIRSKLCGIAGCTCGNDFGER